MREIITHAQHRILVIDDNPAIHDDFRKILTRRVDDFARDEAEFFGEPVSKQLPPDFEMGSAYQGEEGVEKVRASISEGRPYALAFVDVRMPPGMDGIETVQKIWKLDPRLQIVICTAYADYSWEEMLGRLGASDRFLILKKPFASVEALQLACSLCEKWRFIQESRDRLAETESVVEERTRELRASNERLQAEIKERQKAEAHLLRAQRLESIGTLASGIAHDINNMLSPILLSAELLRKQVSEESRDLVNMIETSAERAAQVVRQVLTFARGIEGERVPVRPKDLLREVEKIAGETFPRTIRVESHVPDGLPLLECDATQIHQVLLNLCVNARDAMPDGGTLRIVADEFEVDESYAGMAPQARKGCYVRIRVTDSGSGIPPEVVEQIFDPFFTTKPIGKGTGLGLSTAIGIIRSHEGFIEVQSEVGKGATFAIFLPSLSTGALLPDSRTGPAGPVGQGQLILVVDDECAIRNVTESVLAKNGYRTLAAADGAQAITIFAAQSHRIDAVFTDVLMPEVDGLALCRVLRKIDPSVRILAASGSSDDGRLREIRAMNIGKVLDKPFSTDSLLSAMAETLNARQGAFLS